MVVLSESQPARLSGMAHAFKEVEVYGEEMIRAIGVLTLRAGHLEDYWSFVIEAISGIDHGQARDLSYVGRSNGARLDVIQALLRSSPLLSEARRDYAMGLLEEARSLASKRNSIVHGQFMISTTGGDVPTTERVLNHWEPLKKSPHKSRPINEEEIAELAEAYEALRLKLWHFYTAVRVPTHPDAPTHGVPD
jgi:hypothetical protein